MSNSSDLWRKISIYVCIPALLIAGVNAYNLYAAHQEHLAHSSNDEDDETPEYPYQNIRVCEIEEFADRRPRTFFGGTETRPYSGMIRSIGTKNKSRKEELVYSLESKYNPYTHRCQGARLPNQIDNNNIRGFLIDVPSPHVQDEVC